MSRHAKPRKTRPLHLLLLVALAGLALWRGHALIEQGSHPSEPAPAPPPAQVRVLVTVAGLSTADLQELAEPFRRRGWSVCTGSLDAKGLWERLAHPAGGGAGRTIRVVVAGPEVPETAVGDVELHHREAPGAVIEARRRLDAAAGNASVLWLHLRDLALPPPRPRAARRFLRRRGLKPPPAAVLRNAFAGEGPVPEDAAPAFEALHHRGLSAMRRALVQLLSGGVRWSPSAVVVAGVPGPRIHPDREPLLAAVPGDLEECPEGEEILNLPVRWDQNTWPMPR